MHFMFYTQAVLNTGSWTVQPQSSTDAIELLGGILCMLTHATQAVGLYIHSLHVKVILSDRLSPFIILIGHEAIRQPQDALFVLPLGC